MVEKEDINNILTEILENKNNLVEEEKCSKPEYIQSLPYDNRTTDESKLNERKEAIEDKISSEQKKIKNWESSITEYEKDNEKLKKDLEKTNKKLEDSEKTLNLQKKYISDGLDSVGDGIKRIEDSLFRTDGKKTPKNDLKQSWDNAEIGEWLNPTLKQLDRVKKAYNEMRPQIIKNMNESFVAKEGTLNHNIRDLDDEVRELGDLILDAESKQTSNIINQNASSPAYNMGVATDSMFQRVRHGVNSEKEYNKSSKEANRLNGKIEMNNNLIESNMKSIKGSEKIISDLMDELDKIP